MSSLVSNIPAADPERALKHFESLLEFETDCWMCITLSKTIEKILYSSMSGAKNFTAMDILRAQSACLIPT